MFDFLLTVLHFFLLAGLILVALIIRKRSKLILLFCLLPAAAHALVSVPEPGKGKLLWEGTLSGTGLRIIQIPKTPRPYLPVDIFIQQTSDSSEIWDSIQSVSISYLSPQLSQAYPKKNFQLIQMGDEWGLIQETFRIDGKYQFEISGQDKKGKSFSVQVPVVVQPQNYLKFREEMGYFIIGAVLLGIFLFGLAAYLKKHETKR